MDVISNVIKAMDGDQEAISELYYTTYPKLRAVAVSILKNEADADDIVQDSYIKAFSNLHQLDNAKKFEPWLCRIVSNKCKDYLKKNKPILFSAQDNEENDEPIEWSIEDESKEYDPEAVLISADIRKQIMELLDSLPDEQRICLVYHVVQEMKISEIAELLEVSESTVKSRISYAKSKMQVKIDELEKKGVKLRGFAGFALFPFIRHLFASQSASVPPISAEIVTGAMVGAAEATAAVSETAASSTSAVIGETAKTVVGHTIKHLGVKIVSGIVAVTIATTAIIGITHPELFDNTSEVGNEVSTPTSSDDEIEKVTDEYIKGVFYLAQEMYDKYIYGRDIKTSVLSYTPSNEYVEYNGYFLEKLNDWESYDHFILNLENRFSKAAVTDIISQIQLVDYNGGAFCNLKEGVGDPIGGNYIIEYVQQVSESKYRIHISFLSLAMEQETIDMYCIYENDNWVIDGINFYKDFDSSSAECDKEVFTSHTHNYKKFDVIAATCVEKGYTVYKCACSDSYKADYMEALGHKIVSDKAVANTCTKPGLSEGSHCSVCNTVTVAQKSIAAKGHAWSKWSVTKTADVGVEGEEKHSCSACGETETRSIAALSKENYKEFNEKIGVYHTDNVKYEYLENHFDYSAYIQIYTLNKTSSNETNMINEFKKRFGFTPTATAIIEKVGTYLVDGKVETVYSYSIDDKTYPFVDHELYNVYHQICTDGKSHWVGFAIEGSANDDWGKLMSTSKVQTLKEEMYQMFYSKTNYSSEYIASHDDDFAMGCISQAGTMRTSDGRLIDVLYIYCRELSK